MIMTIVYCIGALIKPGGTESVLVNKANYLAEHSSHKIHIIIAEQQGQPICFDISPKVTVHDMAISTYFGTKFNVKGLTFFYNAYVLRKVYQKLIDAISPDIISVLELGYDDLIIPKLKTKAIKIREIHSSDQAQKIIRGGTSLFSKDLLMMHWHNYLAKQYDTIVLLTEQDAQDRYYFKNKEVLPNCVTMPFDFQKDFQSKRVISVGRLDVFKNFADQIMVWRSVASSHPDWELHIYGDGPEKEKLQKLIIDLQLEKNVFLKGISKAIAQEYSTSAFFIFTSLAEGFGMVLVEAMQMQLPVIAYDCPCGPSAIIEDTANGFLIPLKNKKLLEEKILYLIGNPEQREIMANTALQSSQQYRPEIIMPKWIHLFERLITNR
ncbi:glycosyltransferase family 4 protein [Flavobacterium sp. F-400]|uniref:Glycosyltransferase family 4 protein n=2 Tax=Flavobacteriaceae TaxID=49546 RepID=A0ABR7JIS2_9FLAO|nr:glycosyltransferase family 4 protein [Flavobacterium turcicum]